MNTYMRCKRHELAGKLVAAPAVQEDESPASWIQYVCSSHQYSVTRLENILNVSPRFHDWDLRVSELDLGGVLQRTDRSPIDFARVISYYEYFSRTLRKEMLAELKRGPPKYRWCAACLDEDDRPYLRWWWRLPIRPHCPRHQRPMVSKCGSCQSELILSYALMVNAGRRTPIGDLSHCQVCGFPRLFTESLETPNFRVFGDGLDANQLTISARAARRTRWGQDRFLIDEFRLAVGPRKRPTLSISAATFQSDSVANISFNRDKWSSRIDRRRVTIRDKMAYVLRLIRAEKMSKRYAPQRSAAIGVDSND